LKIVSNNCTFYLDFNELTFYDVRMEVTTLSPIDTWAAVSLPRVDPSNWDHETGLAGLCELRRLQGELDAAKALLVVVVSVETGQDLKATVVRELGVSQADAARIVKTSKIVGQHDGVAAGIASGEYTADHVQRLAKLKNPADVAELLAFASTESSDDFGKRVTKFLVDSAGPERAARQRAERSVKFFNTDEGSIGMRAVIPATAGKILKANLHSIMNAQYLAAYPDRAETADAHNIDSYEQRLADALIEAVNGDTPIPKPSGERCLLPNEPLDIPHWVSDLGEFEHVELRLPNDPLTTNLFDSKRAGKRKKRRGKRAEKNNARPRTAVIVTISLEKLQAQILGDSAIPLADALALIRQARTDLYFCVQNEQGAVLNFGRSRRFASGMQKLALAVRDEGFCSVPDCDVPWDQCDADHDTEFYPPNPGDPLGQTNLDDLSLKCPPHHKHRHKTGENKRRKPKPLQQPKP
jgi:hypothetical protein